MKRWAGLENKNPWMEGIGPRLNAIIHRPDTFLAPTQQASLSAFPRQRSPRHSQAVAPQILQNTDINRLITRLALGVDIYAWKKAGARVEEGDGGKGERETEIGVGWRRWRGGNLAKRQPEAVSKASINNDQRRVGLISLIAKTIRSWSAIVLCLLLAKRVGESDWRE